MDIGSINNNFFDQYALSQNGFIPFEAAGKNKTDANGSFAQMFKTSIDHLKAENSDETAPETGQIRSFKKVEIDKTSKLFEACRDLETFLIKNLITSMRSTVQKTDLLDTGFAGKIYEDMLYDEYAKEFAKNAKFGLAEQAYLELTGQRFKSGSISINNA